MRTTVKLSFPCLFLFGALWAQTYNVTFEKKTGYNGWSAEWDMVYAAKNDIVTLAVVPKLGGRVMQYNLGTNASLYIYDAQQMPFNGNDMVGGFRMLPSPQSDFGWPSPPNLDFNPYTCTEVVNNSDSVVLMLESQVENSSKDIYEKHQGLLFKRQITLYKASTRVRVEMTMLNKGTQTLTHGIWDITQTACASDSNCWVYFQRNPSSTLGGGKGYVQYMNEGTDDTQWKPNAAEGNIMGVQYLKEVGKIGADCRAGWICFNDRQSGYAYVKTFTYQEGKTYPDSGASVQVYTYSNYDMLEVEVLGPLVSLSAGDSTKFVENWYAARSLGPVLAVNSAGLITKRFAAQQTADTVTLTGTFGVFFPGKVKTQFCAAGGAVIATVDSTAVLPTDSLRINKKLGVPANAVSIKLTAFNTAGAPTGTLDSVAVPNSVTIRDRKTPSTWPASISVKARNDGILLIDVPLSGTVTTEVLTVDGRLAASFTEEAPYRRSIDMSTAAMVLLVRVKCPDFTDSRIVYLPGGR
ncbi:MAG: hypothetical protein JW913_07825 [Chitinispirillaceae bacterium]|nr:hypothetical protein [Chitinispirillaceae bacterium]